MRRRLFMRYLVLLSGVASCGFLLLQTSQSVQHAEAEVRALEKAIERERQTIEVLQAEWAYLNTPYRLEKLAQRYLGMVPSDAQYIMPDPRILPEGEALERRDYAEDAVGGENNRTADDVAGVGIIAASGRKVAVPPRKPSRPASWNAHQVSRDAAHQGAHEGVRDAARAMNGAKEDSFNDLMNRIGRAP